VHNVFTGLYVHKLGLWQQSIIVDTTIITHRKPKHSLLFVALCGIAFLTLVSHSDVVNTSTLPEMGDSSAAALSDRDAERLGASLLRHLRARGQLVEDALIADYVRDLGRRLAQYSDFPAGSFTFFVVNSPAINAFAAPGGYIGLHSGLLAAATSEDELAAVTAHEIAHVTQHHMARTYERAGQLQLTTAVSVLAAILLGQVDSQLGEAALITSAAGRAQQEINFIRGGEEEADSIGIGLLSRAGFEPSAMAAFFGRLKRDERMMGSVLPEFLRTHPVTNSRIADANSRAERLPPVTGRRSQTPFLLARTRLSVLTAADAEHALEMWQQHVADDRPVARYGLALALQARERPEAALKVFEPLRSSEPDRPEYLLLHAELLAASGRQSEALATYRAALEIYPGHRAIGLTAAAWLLSAGDVETALTLLNDLQRRLPPEPDLFALLAEASGRTGHDVDTHRYKAEQLLLEARPADAIEQLKLALAAADDGSYQGERLAARLAEVERGLREDTR